MFFKLFGEQIKIYLSCLVNKPISDLTTARVIVRIHSLKYFNDVHNLWNSLSSQVECINKFDRRWGRTFLSWTKNRTTSGCHSKLKTKSISGCNSEQKSPKANRKHDRALFKQSSASLFFTEVDTNKDLRNFWLWSQRIAYQTWKRLES